MSINTIKPAVKAARKTGKASTKNTSAKGNARKAAKAPKMQTVEQAITLPKTLANVDTSSIAVDVVEHTPKQGIHAGILTHQLRLKRADGKFLKISEGLAFAIGEIIEADPATALAFVEYKRVVPHAY